MDLTRWHLNSTLGNGEVDPFYDPGGTFGYTNDPWDKRMLVFQLSVRDVYLFGCLLIGVLAVGEFLIYLAVWKQLTATDALLELCRKTLREFKTLSERQSQLEQELDVLHAQLDVVLAILEHLRNIDEKLKKLSAKI